MRTPSLDDFCVWLEQTPLSQTIQITGWIVPALQTIHILAIAAVALSARRFAPGEPTEHAALESTRSTLGAPDLALPAWRQLYREGATAPKMMSVGMHCRLLGAAARAVGLERILDYMAKHKGVWITKRVDIARHWHKTHPYPGKGLNE